MEITDPETLKFIINHPHPPNFVGFIANYEKSKRFVDYEKLKELVNIEKRNVKFVSVLVNPNDEILEKIQNLNFDYLQLYDVDPQRAKNIKEKYNIKIISALTINTKEDVLRYKKFVNFFRNNSF